MEYANSEVEMLTSNIEQKTVELLELMQIASRKYIEVLHDQVFQNDTPDIKLEALEKMNLRFEEVKYKLKVEFLARFNSEIFFDAIENIPIYPTKLSPILGDDTFCRSRKDYVDEFYGEKLGFL